jgi:hypothetical protein
MVKHFLLKQAIPSMKAEEKGKENQGHDDENNKIKDLA